MPEYVVLVNAAGDDVEWERWALPDSPTVEAPNPDAAINRVREQHAELKGEAYRAAHYATVTPDRIKRMRRRLVESFELGRASEPDDTPAQGTLA